MKIELLYFEGCPSWQNGLERLKKALILEDAALQVEMKLIEHDEAAKKEKFLGSPSFHFDGQDLWPEERDYYFLSCRIYETEVGLEGAPSVLMLRKRIQEILSIDA